MVLLRPKNKFIKLADIFGNDNLLQITVAPKGTPANGSEGFGKRNGGKCAVIVDGVVILDGNIRTACKGHNVDPKGGNENPYTVDHKNHPGLFNKSGHIALCGHGEGLKYRNIRVKEL